MTPREETLLLGLVDWVALDRIHWVVEQSMPDARHGEVQSATLRLIHDLGVEELAELGTVDGTHGFVKWPEPIGDALERIRRSYICDFDNRNEWPWSCWLNLTPEGEDVARRIETPDGEAITVAHEGDDG